MNSIKARMINLGKLIKKYNIAYYVDGEPLIPDYEYDKLFNELIELEAKYVELKAKDSPTNVIYGKDKNGKTLAHQTPMLSIQSEMETTMRPITNFMSKMNNILRKDPIEYIAELKFDGLAVNLTYVDRALKHATTRGDGYSGNYVTTNVMLMNDIPKNLPDNAPDLLEVRGEIFLSIKNFNEINTYNLKHNKKVLSNPRNAASGILRSISLDSFLPEKLSFYAYGVGGGIKEIGIPTQNGLLYKLNEFGFPIYNDFIITDNAIDLMEFYERILKERNELGFEIDGVVYKVNSLAEQSLLSHNNRTVNWAIAHKFPPLEKISTIQEIYCNVSKKGLLIPMARINPVNINGVNITNISLYNQNNINNKDIRVGDDVIIRRSGDVIPIIVKPIVENRTDKSEPFKIYSNNKVCPSCNKETEKIYDGDVYCTNGLRCTSQLIQALAHFAHKDCMNIKGLTSNVITKLLETNKLSSIPDLYRLTVDDISLVYGREKAKVIYDNIQNSCKVKMGNFIRALGFDGLGNIGIRQLCSKTQAIFEILDSDYDTLVCKYNVNRAAAFNIVKFAENEDTKDCVRDLIKLGVEII